MESSVISTATAARYTWGNGCDGWPLVESAGLSVKEEQMPPGSAEQLHYHGKAQQFFYMLEGNAMFEIEGAKIVVKEQEGIRILPGKQHRIMNTTKTGIRFLVISQPAAAGDRVNL